MNNTSIHFKSKAIARRYTHMPFVMGTWFAFVVFPCVASVQHWCVPRSVALDSPKFACFR